MSAMVSMAVGLSRMNKTVASIAGVIRSGLLLSDTSTKKFDFRGFATIKGASNSLPRA